MLFIYPSEQFEVVEVKLSNEYLLKYEKKITYDSTGTYDVEHKCSNLVWSPIGIDI